MTMGSSMYPIGTPGQPWGDREKTRLARAATQQRSYAADVLAVVDALRERFDVQEYGRLDYPPDGTYPLVALRSRAWREGLPLALVTGGVHGYETSGVHGALQFARRARARTTPGASTCWWCPASAPGPTSASIAGTRTPSIRTARSASRARRAESAALMRLVAPLRGQFLVHVDLHETTDTDESEFRPALAARDGKPFEPGGIPDGFYLVDDSENPQPAFQQAIIDAVARSHAHRAGRRQGRNHRLRAWWRRASSSTRFAKLGLCAGITGARYTTTTEVYPDSPRATPAQCNAAQVAAVRAALDYALR